MVPDLPASAFYTGLVADLYTPLKSTAYPAGPYLALIRRHGQPALELGVVMATRCWISSKLALTLTVSTRPRT